MVSNICHTPTRHQLTQQGDSIVIALFGLLTDIPRSPLEALEIYHAQSYPFGK
jgi:hypothetical protein